MRRIGPARIVTPLGKSSFLSVLPSAQLPAIGLQIGSLLSAIFIGLLFGAAVAVMPQRAAGAAPSAPANAASDSSPLSGTWKGVYFIYPNLMGLELKLDTAPGGAISGTLRYYPAVKQRGAFGAPPQGSYNVGGQYAESSHSFTLKPGAWIEKPPMAGATAPLAGVLDTKAKQVAGVFEFQSAASPTFFILAADADGDRLIADITRSAYPAPLPPQAMDPVRQERMREIFQRQIDQIRSMPHPAGTEEQYQKMLEKLQKQMDDLAPPRKPGEWEAPPLEKVQQWVSRLKTEMPAMDLRSTMLGKIYISALNLFDDPYFKEYFGITYEEMDTPQRKAVANIFTKHGQELQEFSFMGRPFQNVGDFGAPDVTVSIYWQRAVRSWLRDVQASFPAMPAELNAFANLAVAESTANAQLAFLWPSDKNKFTAALAETRTRLAASVLKLQADQLIATATGNAGARQLASWRTRQKDVLQYAAPAEQTKAQQRVDARLDELLGALVAADVQALATFGHGLDAVLAGNKWYAQVAKSYDFAMTRPPIIAALRQFQAARARSLAEAKPAIIAQIDATAQDAQVKSILDEYLRCPGDEASEVSVAIRQHAGQRVAAIQHEQLMGLFSEYEKGLMVPRESGHLDLSKADKLHIPQPEEMRLALLRGMAFGTGKVLDAHTAKVSTLFGGGSMIVKISDPDHGRYVYIKERDSWMVLYTVEMHFSLPEHDALWDLDPNFRKGAQMACDTCNVTAALLSKADNIEEFKLYDDGWGVPDMREEGAGRAGMEAMLRGMMKQR